MSFICKFGCRMRHCYPNLNIRFFHVATYNYFRKVLPKSYSNYFETKYFEENINPIQPQQNSNVNFFGIESDEGVLIIDSQRNAGFGEGTPVKNIKVSKEKFYRASYGIVRQDSDNKIRFHGQYGNKIDFDFPHKSTEMSDVSKEYHKVNIMPLSSLHSLKAHQVSNSNVNPPNIPEELSDQNFYLNNVSKNYQIQRNNFNLKESHKMNYIDQCFFGNVNEISSSDKSSDTVDENAIEELGYIDKKYFETDIVTNNHNPTNDQNAVENNLIENGSDEFSYISKGIFGQNVVENNILRTNSNESILDDISHKDMLDNNENKLGNIDSKIIHTLKSSSFPSHPRNHCIKHDSLIKIENHDIEDFSINHLQTSSNVKHSALLQLSNNLSQGDSVEKENSRFNKHTKQKKEVSEKHQKSKIPKHKRFESDENPIHEKSVSVFENTHLNGMSISEKFTDVDKMTTAKEFVEKLRNETKVKTETVKKAHALGIELQDSKGFRILKNQVPDLSHFTKDEIITSLRNNILYSDDDMMILNKPYSLVIHDSETTSSPCLSQLLDDFARITDPQTPEPKLYTVHRLDKETTGCLLLARNEMSADKLKSLFSERKIIKKYWILTSRVPDPLKGVIDIPIAEGSVHNKKRMVLNPKLPQELPYRNHSKNGKRAVTTYRVISISGNAALVEVVPETGLKHQIRVHFGFGLSCPILGDHKYSHLDKMAPQKLSSDLLQRLHVRQAKVRHIPMHIHAHSITIPGYLNGRDLFVSAPPPYHMIANLKKLKFKKKNKLNL